jgi:hypothetical protein
VPDDGRGQQLLDEGNVGRPAPGADVGVAETGLGAALGGELDQEKVPPVQPPGGDAGLDLERDADIANMKLDDPAPVFAIHVDARPQAHRLVVDVGGLEFGVEVDRRRALLPGM